MELLQKPSEDVTAIRREIRLNDRSTKTLIHDMNKEVRDLFKSVEGSLESLRQPLSSPLANSNFTLFPNLPLELQRKT